MANAPKVTKKTRETPASMGRALARDIDRHFVAPRTKSYREAARDFKALEQYYVAKLARHPDLALEVRRRVAESNLHQALLHGCSLSVCRARLTELSNLGFQDVERKAHFWLIFAKQALARGHKRIAKRITSQIIDDLKVVMDKRRNPLAEACLVFAKKIHDSIDERQLP
jgi:hypothetical protein